MIDHISLPVADFARSRACHDKALAAPGCKVEAVCHLPE